MLTPQLSNPCGAGDITNSLLSEPAFVHGLSVPQFPLLVFMSASERLGNPV